MYWSHIWWLIQTVERGVDCNERSLYAALIIHCVDCSVAESDSDKSTSSGMHSQILFLKSNRLRVCYWIFSSVRGVLISLIQ
jgi:hypothetical protein